jgi:hypothetical protein
VKTRRFGEVAVEKGYVSEERLAQALKEQDRASREQKIDRFVGEILLELGFMTEKQVLDVLSTVHDHHATT